VTDPEINLAKGVLRAEAAALESMAACVGPEFSRAVDHIVACANAQGTVLVTGLGKSGLVGAKISATLASLGIPSHPVHPSEAAHGDLGRFRASDTVIAISFSGETDEVVNLCAILAQDNVPIIAITNGRGSEPSSLERLSQVTLRLGIDAEAGEPGQVAPTVSTTATMAWGDALALAAAHRRNFTAEDFARRHPGGTLGGLLRPVTEVLRFIAGKNLPLIPHDVSVAQALDLAAGLARRPGAILIVDGEGRLAGLFTDADLRRLVLRDPTLLHGPIANVMTTSPRTLEDTRLVRDAVNMIREHRQDEIPVVNARGRPVGILDVQDLIAMRLVKD